MALCFASTSHTAALDSEQAPNSSARERSDLLFSTLYTELRGLARRQLSRRATHVRQGTTTLLHEAYLVIAARERARFEDRARFMGYAARVMRGLIIDHTRRRLAYKRGGQVRVEPLCSDVIDPTSNPTDLTPLGHALEALAATEPALAELVDLKFFGGLSCAEIAAMRGTTERTVQRHWERARLYLYRALEETQRA